MSSASSRARANVRARKRALRPITCSSSRSARSIRASASTVVGFSAIALCVRCGRRRSMTRGSGGTSSRSCTGRARTTCRSRTRRCRGSAVRCARRRGTPTRRAARRPVITATVADRHHAGPGTTRGLRRLSNGAGGHGRSGKAVHQTSAKHAAHSRRQNRRCRGGSQRHLRLKKNSQASGPPIAIAGSMAIYPLAHVNNHCRVGHHAWHWSLSTPHRLSSRHVRISFGRADRANPSGLPRAQGGRSRARRRGFSPVRNRRSRWSRPQLAQRQRHAAPRNRESRCGRS